jgi:hypothetical protein
MGWLQFLEKVIGHILSWPVLALVVILTFRKKIGALIERVKSYEGMGQKVTFGEELAEVEEKVDDLTSSQSPELQQPSQDELTDEEPDPYVFIAERAPSAVIIDSWVRIEKAIMKLADLYEPRDEVVRRSQGRFVRKGMRASAAHTLGYLAELGVIPASMFEVITRLRQLRNAVAHGAHEPTPGEATTYRDTAREVWEILERLATLADKEQSDRNGDTGEPAA